MSFESWTDTVYGIRLRITKGAYDPLKVAEFIELYQHELRHSMGDVMFEEYGFEELLSKNLDDDGKAALVDEIFLNYENENGETLGVANLIIDVLQSADGLPFNAKFVAAFLGEEYPDVVIGIASRECFPWSVFDHSEYMNSGITEDNLIEAIVPMVRMLMSNEYLSGRKLKGNYETVHYCG